MRRRDDTDDTGDIAPARRRRGSRRRRIVAWIAVLTTVLVTGTSLAAYAAYLGTLHSIETFSTRDTLGTHRPPVYNSAENILLVGSDSRAGSNERFGKNVQGQRSDTMLILHIRPAHTGAVVISLPRDTLVPVIACGPDGLGDPGQPAQPGQTEMLNATFAFGGPPCLWKTVEQETGIRIDHYVGLTFTGFQQVINDLGGVSVCLPEAINDSRSNLHLSAGKHHIGGFAALAFWRERYVGEGSDLQRIQRQQYLMAGLVQEVKSGQLLGNYGKLYSVIRDAARALTTDDGLSLSDMISLAGDLKLLSTKSVQFVTVPNTQAPSDPNRVVWQEPQADELFHAIAHDAALPKTPRRKAPARSTTLATASPGSVQVAVYNGNGQPGAATQAASDLTSKGFRVTGTANASSSTFTDSVIQYSSPADLAKVNTLKAELSSVQVQRVPGIARGTIYLIVGSTFTGLHGSSSASTAANGSSSSGSLGKSYGGINASANICSDSGAFTGPDNPSAGT